jgi:hypothetical protein
VACAKHPGPSDNAMRAESCSTETDSQPTSSQSPSFVFQLGSIRCRESLRTIHHTQPCRPTILTSMEGRSQSHKDLPHLLAHLRVHHLRSSWHGVDRELEGCLVKWTPFRRKICASGAYRGSRGHFYFILQCNLFSRSGYHSLKSFDQTFHLEKRWKLVREMGSGAYGVVM